MVKSRNGATVYESLLCIKANLERLYKDPTSRESLRNAEACWNQLAELLGIPGICKFGLPKN